MKKIIFLVTLCLYGCPETRPDRTSPPEPDQAPPSEGGVIIDLDMELIDLGRGEIIDQGLAMNDQEMAPDLQGAYGDPCRSNVDCVSGFCIASPRGFLCSQGCLLDQDCPDAGGPMGCNLYVENFGPDRQQICSPEEGSLCQPCFRDDHCFGGRCILGPQGNVCSVNCDDEGACPQGSECQTQRADGTLFESPQCVPDIALCGCGPEQAGETRSCVRTSPDISGRCFGQEVCDPELGWSGCDAALPSPEVCDGVDNNCNGAIDDGLETGTPCLVENEYGACSGTRLCEGAQGWSCLGPAPSSERCDLTDNDCDEVIDEGFIDGVGLYSSTQHCGGCNISCDELLPLAETTECITQDGESECVITTCREGFVLEGPTTCVPLTSRLCETCERDADCNADLGDRCIEYQNGNKFCGRACGEDSPFGVECPEGFSCDESGQCRIDVGTCLCSANDSFIIPCSLTSPTDPNVRCVGTLTCDRGDLSACELPQERCDGFDDDCDGSIDEGFVDPMSGAYVSDEHCGRCDYNCAALVSGEGMNGVGICDPNSGDPVCALRCDAGFVDVNGVQADGCECQVLDAQNDDPDRQGVDANCDGIDGVVARGIFVSPTGDDMAAGTREAPMRTIQAAIQRADGTRDHVYVAAGVYTEQLSLRPGVSLFGGYSADYQRRDLRGNETAIFPPLESAGDRFGTVSGFEISGSETIMAGFTIVGYAESRPGRSSYAVYLRNCSGDVSFTDNVIRAGTGGAGLRGQSGDSGTAAPDNATQGAPERSASANTCFNTFANRSPGGQGGRHQCVGSDDQPVSTHGGDGGMADCPTYDQPEESGFTGQSGDQGGMGGRGGYSQQLVVNGPSCACLVPQANNSTQVGIPGVSGQSGELGTAGEGCAQSNGRVIEGQWVAGDIQFNEGRGGDGLSGQPGGGGGGGGAGSGVEHGSNFGCNAQYDEVIGGGGGGGGAGGCGGTGGRGGSAGGGAFGVFIFFTQARATLPSVRDNRIERGFGGVGGDGGEGGEGGEGGLGKEAQTLTGDERVSLLACADPGGRGGDGGEGGDGGGGGGGCGGIAAGIFINGFNGVIPPSLNATNQFPQTGAAGTGGRGGLSLGLTGASGADGNYVEVAQ